jgi:hypothetical protein
MTATAVCSFTASLLFLGCSSPQNHAMENQPHLGAFDPLGVPTTRLVAGDALGVDLHLVAASRPMIAYAK